MMRQALATSKKSQLYVELFFGTGVLSRKLEACSGYAVLSFDLAADASFDLSRPVVQQVILGWIASRVVRGVWCGFPCTTWSTARWPPLRSAARLRGLPEKVLSPIDAQKVRTGNATIDAAKRVARACAHYIVPCILENPHSSLAWQEAGMAQIRRLACAQEVVVDYCQYGSPWRKRTRLLCLHIASTPSMCRRCAGKQGICSRTKSSIKL